MATLRVGLANKATGITAEEVEQVAAALRVQVKRDLHPVWKVGAEIIVLDGRLDIPHGVSPILIVDELDHDIKGAHQIEQGVAFAIISAKYDWKLAASHELIEMLVDPAGGKTEWSLGLELAGDQIRETSQKVEYLVEACDPTEDPSHSYEIGGVKVSDFYTPAYFNEKHVPGTKYSHAGSLTRPREVPANGYLSWYIPGTRQLRQLRNFDGYEIVDMPGGPAEGQTTRNFVDQNTKTPRTHPELHVKKRVRS